MMPASLKAGVLGFGALAAVAFIALAWNARVHAFASSPEKAPRRTV